MKPFSNPLLRIIPALIIGIPMIVWPKQTLHYIAIILGLVLLLPGLIQTIRYILMRTDKSRRVRRNSTMTFPFISTLCLLTGIAILCYPGTVARIFIYLLGAFLAFAGIYEILFLALLRRRLPAGYYILPILLLLTGISILINPFTVTENILMTIFGAGTILYSLSETIYYFKFRNDQFN